VTQQPSNASSIPRLSVVIVNYLANEPLTNCLESLAPFVAPAEIVVVDHQTQPQTLGRLATQFPGVRFIPIAGNPGFAAGVNRGVRETTGEYVLLLNPDCLVTSDPHALVSWLNAHPKAAVCGALVREADGSVQASARWFPGVTTGLAGRTSWLTRVWPDNPWTTRNLVRALPGEPIEVDWVSGACMMVRRVAFAAVGGMDEQFFLYWEDADLCRRLKQAGWLTYYNPNVSVTHLTGQSSRHAREASLVAFHESAYRYYCKYGIRWLTPLAFVALQARLRVKLAMLRRDNGRAPVVDS
jgi:N-acetylglucosaminyl-diphospho-decaprenol L-rhamnosyltransferase